PSRPQPVKTEEVGTTWVLVSWQPPASPNGVVTHYVVSITPLQQQQQQQQQLPKFQHCSEFSSKPRIRTNREKRSVVDINREESYKIEMIPKYTSSNEVRNPENNTYWNTIDDSPYNFTNLVHFSTYLIWVSACQEPNQMCNGNPHNKTCALCSQVPATAIITTLKTRGTKLVNEVGLLEQNSSSLVVWWSEMLPHDTGQVVGYRLEVKRRRNDNGKLSPTLLEAECISASIFRQHNHTHTINTMSLEPDTYTLTIVALRKDGVEDSDSKAYIHFEKKAMNESGVGVKKKAWIVVVVLVAMIPVGVATFKVISRHDHTIAKKNPNDDNDHHSDPGISLWRPDEFGIASDKILDPKHLTLHEGCPLGKGNFGRVMRGEYDNGGDCIPVAVKVPDTQARQDILVEASLMLKLRCHHIVKAYGVVLFPDVPFLVMELMCGGDLHTYLKSLTTQLHNNICTIIGEQDVCGMAVQIADGMAYLASEKIVHRDLAARNCLVNGKFNIKIADFGMTRMTNNDYYRIRETKYFPVRWLPPEYLKDRKFTSQSDVWSYGIVLWEILTGGMRPYQDICDNKDVWNQVMEGQLTLEPYLPQDIPEYLCDVVRGCWRYRSHQRPHFIHIIDALLQNTSIEFQQNFRSVAFYHTAEGQTYRQHLDTSNTSNVTTPLTTSSASSPSSIDFFHPLVHLCESAADEDNLSGGWNFNPNRGREMEKEREKNGVDIIDFEREKNGESIIDFERENRENIIDFEKDRGLEIEGGGDMFKIERDRGGIRDKKTRMMRDDNKCKWFEDGENKRGINTQTDDKTGTERKRRLEEERKLDWMRKPEIPTIPKPEIPTIPKPEIPTIPIHSRLQTQAGIKPHDTPLIPIRPRPQTQAGIKPDTPLIPIRPRTKAQAEIKLDSPLNPIRPRPKALAESKPESPLNPIHPRPKAQAEIKPDTPLNPIHPRPKSQAEMRSRTLPKPGKPWLVTLDRHGLPSSGLLHTNDASSTSSGLLHNNNNNNTTTTTLSGMSEFSSHSFPNLRECSRLLSSTGNKSSNDMNR
ncbi:hypothetical protein Pmani_039593, partial [Petrolisthes manimaculis]